MESLLVTTALGVFEANLEDSGTLLHVFQDSDAANHLVRVSENNNCFAATGGTRALISFWKFSEKTAGPFYKVSTPEKIVCMHFSADGSLLFAGGVSGSVFIWQTFTGSLLKQWTAHFSEIVSIKMNSDESLLVTASRDNSIKIFANIFSGPVSAQTTLSGHSLPIRAISIAGGQLFSISDDSILKIWDFPIGKETKSVSLPSPGLAIAADLFSVFVGLENGQIFCMRNEDSIVDAHGGPVNSVALNMDGSRLVSSSTVDGVRVWDARKLQTLRTITLAATERSPPLAVAIYFNPSVKSAFSQLKPLQRVLTEIEKIQKIERRVGSVRKNIFSDEEREWVLSKDFFSQVSLGATTMNVEEAVAEVEKQRLLTLEWIEVCKAAQGEETGKGVTMIPDRPSPVM
jgi:WD40 repeat protein